MSYQSGKMGIAECLAMVFIMTFARIFLTTPARTLMEQASLAWVAGLLSGLAAIVILFVINRLFLHQSGDLLQVAEAYLGKPGLWLIGLYYIGVFLIDAMLLLRQYTENTLLTALPQIEFTLVLVMYGFTIAVMLYIGLEPICRATYLIMPFALGGLLIVLAALIPFYDVYGLFPLQGRGIDVLFGKGLLGGGINIACIAPALLANTFHDRKTWFAGSLFGVSLSIGFKSLAILVFTLIFGTAVGQERILPFYELSRLVYLGRFVQRIEALFIMLWVINGILAIALHIYIGLYLFTRLFDLPSMRPLLPIMIILIASLTALPEDVAAILELESSITRTLFNGGLYGIPLLLLLLSLWKGGGKARRKSCSG
jgi:hypothetical protein